MVPERRGCSADPFYIHWPRFFTHHKNRLWFLAEEVLLWTLEALQMDRPSHTHTHLVHMLCVCMHVLYEGCFSITQHIEKIMHYLATLLPCEVGNTRPLGISEWWHKKKSGDTAMMDFILAVCPLHIWSPAWEKPLLQSIFSQREVRFSSFLLSLHLKLHMGIGPLESLQTWGPILCRIFTWGRGIDIQGWCSQTLHSPIWKKIPGHKPLTSGHITTEQELRSKVSDRHLNLTCSALLL